MGKGNAFAGPGGAHRMRTAQIANGYYGAYVERAFGNSNADNLINKLGTDEMVPTSAKVKLVDFLKEIRTINFLKPDGNPEANWRMFKGHSADSGFGAAIEASRTKTDDGYSNGFGYRYLNNKPTGEPVSGFDYYYKPARNIAVTAWDSWNVSDVVAYAVQNEVLNTLREQGIDLRENRYEVNLILSYCHGKVLDILLTDEHGEGRRGCSDLGTDYSFKNDFSKIVDGFIEIIKKGYVPVGIADDGTYYVFDPTPDPHWSTILIKKLFGEARRGSN